MVISRKSLWARQKKAKQQQQQHKKHQICWKWGNRQVEKNQVYILERSLQSQCEDWNKREVENWEEII